MTTTNDNLFQLHQGTLLQLQTDIEYCIDKCNLSNELIGNVLRSCEESGPLVRSSYHADEQARTIFNNNE